MTASAPQQHRTTSDFDALHALVQQYFDGLYDGDVDVLSRIFHARSRLHVMLEGKLFEIDYAPYMEVVRNRPSPRSAGARRRDEIILIQQTTTDTALVIVSLLLSGKSYTDQLSLIRDEGRWQIVSKVYHLNGVED